MQSYSTLLPSGFSDLLPPDAWRERKCRSAVLESFRSFGYEEVLPPLLEFEDNLLEKDRLNNQTFRVMDTASQRMMGLRADMTPQIARIASSRMEDEPLPLRLCYAGTCLRVKGQGLYKSRQLVQAGIECIGTNNDNTLIEILRCAQETLAKIGINDLTLDISLPRLVSSLLQDIPEEKRDNIRRAVMQKDRHTIAALDKSLSEILLTLMDGATIGDIEKLEDQLPDFASYWLGDVKLIKQELPSLEITLDPLEESGFGYYRGITFSLFSKSLGYEIGRGGRYIAHDKLVAYGFTLYLTPFIYKSSLKDKAKRCLILPDADESIATNLREEGWRTIYASATSSSEINKEAKQLKCSYILKGDKVTDV